MVETIRHHQINEFFFCKQMTRLKSNFFKIKTHSIHIDSCNWREVGSICTVNFCSFHCRYTDAPIGGGYNITSHSNTFSHAYGDGEMIIPIVYRGSCVYVVYFIVSFIFCFHFSSIKIVCSRFGSVVYWASRT